MMLTMDAPRHHSQWWLTTWFCYYTIKSLYFQCFGKDSVDLRHDLFEEPPPVDCARQSLNQRFVCLLRNFRLIGAPHRSKPSVQARNDTGKPINSWQFRDILCVKTLTYTWSSDVRRSFILTRQPYRESITWQSHLETAAQSVPNISCLHIMFG